MVFWILTAAVGLNMFADYLEALILINLDGKVQRIMTFTIVHLGNVNKRACRARLTIAATLLVLVGKFL